MSHALDASTLTMNALAFSFFQSGYADGYAHGRIHGLIEGRAVGKEKGLELWEEVGYYRGFATIWQATYDRKKDNLNTER